MSDFTPPKDVSKPEGLAPEGYVVPDKYQDRLIAPPVATTRDVLQHEREEPLGPVVLTVDAQTIGAMYASRATPFQYTQMLLERFKALGVPVEGMLRHRLVMGKIAKVKPDPGMQDQWIRYIWLPDEHVQALAQAGLKGVN
jgi:hypothetical protein